MSGSRSWNELLELALARGLDPGEAAAFADEQLAAGPVPSGEPAGPGGPFVLSHGGRLRVFEDGGGLIGFARRLWLEQELDLPPGWLSADDEEPRR